VLGSQDLYSIAVLFMHNIQQTLQQTLQHNIPTLPSV